MDSRLLFLAALIVLSAIFSGSETALVSISDSKVDSLVANKRRNSRLLRRLKNDPHKLLITILIGNNIVNIGASAYAAVIFSDYFGSNAVGIATGVMTFFILIFGEITPKSFAHQYSAGVSLFMARPISVLQFLLYPFVWFFEKIVHLMNRFFGNKRDTYSVTEGELLAMVNIGAKEGAIEKAERELIENVLEFNDINVEDVMTPRVAMDALDCEITIQEAVNYVKKHTHSRLPVFKGSLDNIIGIISIKTLLKYFDECSPRRKLKNLEISMPLEVPHTKKINKLFREFQRKHVHIAIVIDEFGGTAGLVTLEDLLEEIVGDIVDESDRKEKPFEVVDKKTILVSGGTLVEDVNDFFKLSIWPDDHDTINTLLVEHLGRFPREGETVKLSRVRIKIDSMDKNVLKRATVKKTIVRKKKD